MGVETTPESLAVRAGAAFTAYRIGETHRMGELVELLTPVLWHTARGQGLASAAAQDVVQTTWLRLVENADKVSDPRAVMQWLIVTARREAWRMSRNDRRITTELDTDTEDPGAGPATRAMLGEQQHLLWDHVGRLSPRCQQLLRVVAFADRPDYSAVSRALGMPVGSIGPTRGRCLAKLRESLLGDPAWAGAL